MKDGACERRDGSLAASWGGQATGGVVAKDLDIREFPAETAGAVDAESIKARVAWYYYAGGLTQQEIADRLGITRLRVNRIVGQVRSDGSVAIDIRIPVARCVALEEQLRERYGLADVRVVPALPDGADQQRAIGEAAGLMLDPLLRDGQGLGVGLGRTLSTALRRITPRRFARAWVATLLGGLTRGSVVNTFEISADFARTLGAECFYIAAPIYCPSPESRTALTTHYGLAEALRRARLVDVALVSCSDVSERSLLVGTQNVQENLPGLAETGAVGDILGVFLNADGEPVDHALNERVIGLTPMELKAIPASILASGGSHKVRIIRAILTGGYVNRLVTDEETAEALLRSA